MKKKSILLLPFLVFGLSLAACTSSTKKDPEPVDPSGETVKVSGVSLDKSSLEIEVDAQATLVATVKPDNATNKEVTWSTSNSAVATVNGGVVKGVTPGTAKITVTTKDGSKTAECNVTVKAKAESKVLVSLTVTGYKQQYEVGDQLGDLTVVANYSDGTHLNVMNYQVTGFDSSAPAENQKVTVTYSGVSFEFYVTIVAKEPTPVTEAKWYVAGQLGTAEWNDEIAELVEHTYEGEDTTVAKEYHATVTFAQNDKWLVKNDAETPEYIKTLEDTVVGMHNDSEDNGNIVIDVAGTYDIYFKLYTEESGKAPTIWAGAQGGDPTPTVKVFTVQFGDGDPITLSSIDKDENEPATMIGKYKGTASVTAGQTISFKLNDAVIRPGDENEAGKEHNGNNTAGTWDDGYTVHNDAANAEVYLKEYSDGGYSFWLTGYVPGGDPTPTPTPVTDVKWYVAGQLGAAEWNNEVAELVEHTYEGEDTTVAKEYHAAVEFAQNDKWLVKNTAETPEYIKTLEEGVVGMHNDSEDSNNIVIDVAGTYDIYFKLYTEESHKAPTIWAKAQGGDPTPTPDPDPTPVTDVKWYVAGQLGTAEWNNEVAELTEHTYEGEDATVAKEFHAVVEFAQNDKWLVKNTAETPEYIKTLEEGVVGMHNDSEDSNNIVIDVAGTYDIYFKLYTEESHKAPTIWAKAQGADPTPTPDPDPTPVVYTVNTTSSWNILEYDAKFAVWAVGGVYGSGTWVAVTHVSGTGNADVFSVTLDPTATLMVIVRINPSAAEPSWADGVKWGQTGDINIVGGTVSYDATWL